MKPKKKGPNLGFAMMFLPIGAGIGVAINNLPLGAGVGGLLAFLAGGAAYVLHARKKKA